MEIYKYRTGVVSTEQDLMPEIHTFLTSVIGGWTRVEIISDASDDRDYAWSSDGEDDRDTGIQGADPIVIRIRAYSNKLYQFAYGTYTSSTENTFELYDSSKSASLMPTGPFRYWLYGNKNFLCYIVEYNAGQPIIGYMGLVESFYVPETDPLPLANRGQQYYYTPLNGSSTNCMMHSVTTSGELYYQALDFYTICLAYDVSNRSSSIVMLPVVLSTDTSASSPDYECRGSFYGVYQINGNRVGNPAVITTASGIFMSFKVDGEHSDCNVFGPVAATIGEFPGLYINGTTGYSP
ncbi:MAG: hypothetical protein KAS32_31090 [Candidatus Peribacteraceae bacterium]|nr:hypothetical protein [Candidatus Peribacteraceae bacterium]